MHLTYLGTATILLELDGQRFLTDPAFDPKDKPYDFGPWYTPASWFYTEKTYETPMKPAQIGALDAILCTHDHHADNLDFEGRKLMASDVAKKTICTKRGAARLAKPARPDASGNTRPGHGLGLGERAIGLAWGESTKVGNVTITATPARHGPHGTPRIHEVIGFLLEPASPSEPVVWISGDTVEFPALVETVDAMKTRPRRVDVAVMHAGAVNFPKLPIVGKRLFTFDAGQLVSVAQRLDPKLLVPVHREGWSHFRQPVAELRAALQAGGLMERTRWLELGESLTVATRSD